ncbi:MAG TPA: lytic transglycosylase domain-containing protein [Firmicutes bacterium]|nr:lytic transglycosylase domain-containing protein [Bacillota bacterium]
MKHLIILFISTAILVIISHTVSACQVPMSCEPSQEQGEPADHSINARLILALIEEYNPTLSSCTKQSILQEILKSSIANNLDPLFVTAVIAAESSFRPNAVSHCGAIGLMQLTQGILQELNIKDPYAIAENIAGGCAYLAKLRHRFGDLSLALAAYNAGPTRVARLNRIPRIPETQNYIKKICQITKDLKQKYLAQHTLFPVYDHSVTNNRWNNCRPRQLGTKPLVIPFIPQLLVKPKKKSFNTFIETLLSPDSFLIQQLLSKLIQSFVFHQNRPVILPALGPDLTSDLLFNFFYALG